MKNFVKNLVLYLIIIVSSFLFIACDDTNRNENSKDDIIVELTLDNYIEYFVLQEEIVSYSSEPYQKHMGGSTYWEYIRASQITKFCINVLQGNVKFDNLKISIALKEQRTNSGNQVHWTAEPFVLIISYDGKGVFTSIANFNSVPKHFLTSPKYEIKEITGKVIIQQ